MNDSAADGSSGAGKGEGAPDPAVPVGVASRPSLLLARIGAALEAAADEWLAPSGLTGRDYAVLAILTDDIPDTQLDLARMLGKAPGIVVIAVDRLEHAGLVERQRDPADRRRSRVTVTAEGRRALRKADRIADGGLARLLPGLDSPERKLLCDLLARGAGQEARQEP
jgi:MarR family transcriptional regulator, lower aerobic nicotinate degradation pathway regulator